MDLYGSVFIPKYGPGPRFIAHDIREASTMIYVCLVSWYQNPSTDGPSSTGKLVAGLAVREQASGP